jgi:hypothetical protein
VISVPDQVAKPLHSHVHDIQTGIMLWLKGIHPAERLVDVPDAHRDMPPDKDMDDGTSRGGPDQFRKPRFAVAADRYW